MAHPTFSFNHNPTEFIPIINEVCNQFKIQYRIFSLEEGFRGDLLYKDTRYTGGIDKTIESNILGLLCNIKYVLCSDIDLKVNDNVLESLQFLIDTTKKFIKCTH